MKESITHADQFTLKGNIAENQSAVHEGVKYPCKQCGLKFTVKGSLVKHQRVIHKVVKHPCKLCGHKFTSQGYLG